MKGWRGALPAQSTVEAAFMIPVLLVTALLLIQPGILLYDRMVMQGAATEACRLLATASAASGADAARCEEFVRNRLGSIPPADIFHVHGSGCSWDIGLEGNESSEEVCVTIKTEVRPLPLIDVGVAALGIGNGNGNLEVQVESRRQTQPGWVAGSEKGMSPSGWIGAWAQ